MRRVVVGIAVGAASAALLAGCGGEPSAADTGSPPVERFSYAVIADPHVTGGADAEERLSRAVDHVNGQVAERGVELVLVVGDIAWSGAEGRARDLLDALAVPYLPVLGDNNVSTGGEQAWDAAFGPVIDALADRFDDFRRHEVVTWDPRIEADTWLQDYALTHRGVRFVVLDINPRGDVEPLPDLGDLKDFEGGTWPFALEELSAGRPPGSVVLVSHIPMHIGLLDAEELAMLTRDVLPVSAAVQGNQAGHMHVTYDQEVPEGGYVSHVTDATWDDEVTVRYVAVEGSPAAGYTAVQDVVEVP